MLKALKLNKVTLYIDFLIPKKVLSQKIYLCGTTSFVVPENFVALSFAVGKSALFGVKTAVDLIILKTKFHVAWPCFDVVFNDLRSIAELICTLRLIYLVILERLEFFKDCIFQAVFAGDCTEKRNSTEPFSIDFESIPLWFWSTLDCSSVLVRHFFNFKL